MINGSGLAERKVESRLIIIKILIFNILIINTAVTWKEGLSLFYTSSKATW